MTVSTDNEGKKGEWEEATPSLTERLESPVELGCSEGTMGGALLPASAHSWYL